MCYPLALDSVSHFHRLLLIPLASQPIIKAIRDFKGAGLRLRPCPKFQGHELHSFNDTLSPYRTQPHPTDMQAPYPGHKCKGAESANSAVSLLGLVMLVWFTVCVSLQGGVCYRDEPLSCDCAVLQKQIDSNAPENKDTYATTPNIQEADGLSSLTESVTCSTFTSSCWHAW